VNGKKTVTPELITKELGVLGLAYWIMSDGSLQNDGRTMIIHTESFTRAENETLSRELNAKFHLHTQVIPHKDKYWVISIPGSDAQILQDLIAPHILPSFVYKLPTP
jgi:hypothetical protein